MCRRPSSSSRPTVRGRAAGRRWRIRCLALTALAFPLSLSAQSGSPDAGTPVPPFPADSTLYTFCRAGLAETWIRNDAIGVPTPVQPTVSGPPLGTNRDGTPACDPPPPALSAAFLGYTFCRDGMAETWIRLDVTRSVQLGEVQAHEAVHRQQAARYGPCEAFFATLRSARRIVEVEMPAYCAQLEVATRFGGGDHDTLAREYALRIAAQSGAMENRLDILLAFRRACP